MPISSSQGRLATLMARKAQLEAALQRENLSSAPDSLRITAIKRQKLHVKEAIRELAEAS